MAEHRIRNRVGMVLLLVLALLPSRTGQAQLISNGLHRVVTTLRANYTTAQTDTAIITVSAGTRVVVVGVEIGLGGAVTVNVPVRIGFGTSTTPTTTGVIVSHPNIVAGSGIVWEFNMPRAGASDEDVRITSGVPTTGSLDVVIAYYTTAS